MTSEPMVASLLVVRSYEVVAALLFVGGALWVWRTRDPLYYGAYIGSSIGGGVFEWVFDGRYFFRLTSDEKFIAAWTMGGVSAPLAMILFYAFFFGIPLMLMLSRHDVLVRRFGPWAPYAIFAFMGVFGTPLFECTNTSVAGIYRYHQAERFLLWGMPWSNLWFGVLMFVFPYWGLVQARWLIAASGGHCGTGRASQRQLALSLGFGSIITGFFLASVINGVWYAYANPWIETTRPF